MSACVLIVDDDPLVPRTLKILFEKRNHVVETAPDAETALRLIEQKPFDVVISDINMPGADGLELLKRIKRIQPETEVILVTGYGTIESAVRCMREGAFDYVTKPVLDEEILLTLDRAVRTSRLRSENADLRARLATFEGPRRAVGQDPEFLRVFEMIDSVAPSKATVLITGESGTGKSMIARMIHEASDRENKPFVELNCGAMPEGLVESELFGHTKGAFTGATNTRSGKFMKADSGTLFLDEIGTASPALQVKLLRVLQDRTFEPVGSEDTVEVDVRMILATNEDLQRLVEEARFRRDLFYRVSVLPIHLPPLRERRGDIPLLAMHFLKKHAQENERDIRYIDDNAMTILMAHSWPGNIRELENAIARGVILSRGDTITPSQLPPDLTREVTAPAAGETVPLKRALEIPEREIILRTLKSHNWNRQETAAALDINRTTLFNKMRKYGLLDKTRRRTVRAEGA